MAEKESSDDMIGRRRAIQKIELLPTIPIMLQKIIETSNDPKSSAKDLQDTIVKDQSISSAILKLANSAYYGYAKAVEDIQRAVIVIGFNMAVSVAISVSVLKTVATKVTGDEFSPIEFWKHTIASGEAAKIL
ncbi:HDOD domain-containing protein, partial [candidate division KSB1 bacterium]